MKHAVVALIAAFQLGSLPGCQTFRPQEKPLQVSLIADSAEITAHLSGNAYIASIGFTLTNTTAGAISRAVCGGHDWPGLEKKVNDRWVAAYYPVSLLCRTVPDWSLNAGSVFHDILQFMASKPGSNIHPELMVESIDGVYRLHWGFMEGREVDAKGARRIDVVSNEFHITLASSPVPASRIR